MFERDCEYRRVSEKVSVYSGDSGSSFMYSGVIMGKVNVFRNGEGGVRKLILAYR